MELNVLILDDEYIILDGLCAFPWEMYGCRVVAKAENGIEGLKFLEEFQPDIILSDIKMPEMDGLEFSKKAKQICPDSEIILLTGCDNFEFAQKAITVGIFEYLLKPINFKEMHDVVEKVCTSIRASRKSRQDYREMRRKYQEAIPVVRSKVIADLIHGRFNGQEAIKNRMKMLNIRIEQYVLVYGTITQAGSAAQEELGIDLFDFVVCNVCEEILRGVGLQVYYEIDTLGYCFIITFPGTMAARDCERRCLQACEAMQEQLEEVVQTGMSLGISRPSTDPCHMSQAYAQAAEACEQSSYLGEDAGISAYADIADVEFSVWSVTDGEKKRLLSELRQGNVETARNFISQIFAGCEDIDAVRYEAMELLICCFHYLGNELIQVYTEKERSTLLADSLRKMYGAHTRRDLLEVLGNTLSYLAEQNKGARMSRNQRAAEQIIAYIRDRYREDLGLDSLAEQFHLSKTYINRLLKKFSGKSFLEILLECRMVRAEQLIVEDRYKMYEIAEMVGYRDQSYFIKVFKKYFGVTPNAYRRI